MKLSRILTGSAVAMALVLGAFTNQAAEKKAKPYPLKTCVVSGEKLDEDPNMKPHSFVHEGQEVKLCCKSCLKDFKKDPSSYIKKIEEASKKK